MGAVDDRLFQISGPQKFPPLSTAATPRGQDRVLLRLYICACRKKCCVRSTALVSADLMFPSIGLQSLNFLVMFLGVSILSHCISRRVIVEKGNFHAIRHIPWARLCILLVFADSWLFIFTSGLLTFGIGLQTAHAVCSLAIYICIGFYATSKIFIYFFLIEKIHVVWSPLTGGKRWHSFVYCISALQVGMYSVVVILMVLGNIHEFRNDGACVIGLKRAASIPLLSYDLYVNVYLTTMFLWPLFHTAHMNHKIRAVALRTLVASIVALTTSCVNILVLTLLHGRELGWVCLGSCGADVVINALALFWVTSGGHNSDSNYEPSSGRQEPDPRSPQAKGGHICIDDRRASTAPGHRSQYRRNAADRQDGIFSSPRTSVVRIGKNRQMLSKGIAGLFRKDSREPEERTMEITVTTEMNVLDDSIGDVGMIREQEVDVHKISTVADFHSDTKINHETV